MADTNPPQPPTGMILGGRDLSLWSMPAAERARRVLSRAGVSAIDSLAAMAPEQTVVALQGDWVMDVRLAAELVRRPGVALIADSGEVVAAHGSAQAVGAAFDGRAAGLVAVRADQLGTGYDAELRRRGPPLLVRLTPANVRAVEGRLFADAYKGVTDVVTKHVWPTPARIVVRWCAAAGITPNTVTLASLVLVLVTFGLFWVGWYGPGLLAAWVMTFLDTVDGKLARVTLTSSRFGNVFDHGIDLIHPPFWWWAWIVGLLAAGHPLGYARDITILVVVGGYVVQRLIEGAFLLQHRLEVHSWRPFDSWFRLITARRNPNLILLSVGWLAGRPDLGVTAVALWTLASLVVHLVQLAQAQWERAWGRRLTSWMAA